MGVDFSSSFSSPLQTRKSHVIFIWAAEALPCSHGPMGEGFEENIRATGSAGQEDCGGSERQPGGEGHGEGLLETEQGHRLYDRRVSLRIDMAA